MKNDCFYYPKKQKIYVNCYFYGFWIEKNEFLKFNNINLNDCYIIND